MKVLRQLLQSEARKKRCSENNFFHVIMLITASETDVDGVTVEDEPSHK